MAESESTLSKRLGEQFLTCQICLDALDQPKSLPCMHAFCKDCLEAYALKATVVVEGVRQFPCPMCRNDTIIPGGGVTNFKHSFILDSLKDALAAPEESQRTNTLAKSKEPQSRMHIPCAAHADEETVSVCLTCNIPMCLKCVLNIANDKPNTGHRTHKVTDLKEALVLLSQAVDGYTEKVDVTSGILESNLAHLDACCKNVQDNKNEVQEEVELRWHAARTAVDLWKDLCLNEIKTIYDEEMKISNSLREDMIHLRNVAKKNKCKLTTIKERLIAGDGPALLELKDCGDEMLGENMSKIQTPPEYRKMKLSQPLGNWLVAANRNEKGDDLMKIFGCVDGEICMHESKITQGSIPAGVLQWDITGPDNDQQEDAQVPQGGPTRRGPVGKTRHIHDDPFRIPLSKEHVNSEEARTQSDGSGAGEGEGLGGRPERYGRPAFRRPYRTRRGCGGPLHGYRGRGDRDQGQSGEGSDGDQSGDGAAKERRPMSRRPRYYRPFYQPRRCYQGRIQDEGKDGERERPPWGATGARRGTGGPHRRPRREPNNEDDERHSEDSSTKAKGNSGGEQPERKETILKSSSVQCRPS